MDLKKFIKKINNKSTFCPGPGSVSQYNILGLRNTFGRNDGEYLKIEKFVLNKLKKISEKKNIVTFQGSGTLAIELMVLNFLKGKIAVISTGYYSDRVIDIIKRFQKNYKIYSTIKIIPWTEIYSNKIKSKFDWVIACPTETSKALLVPIKDLSDYSKKCGAKLMLDATGSIGLEKNHKLASVISFSSCKGIFGLTGAAFIGYDIKALKKRKLSFYQDLNTHLEKKVTGPYSTICSLYLIMKNFEIYKSRNQPNLCTYTTKKIKKNKKVILYLPRSKSSGSIVSHLGEIHLADKSKGKILDKLKFY
jgi:2-aminoethylphosphonate-pyruvate transaminase